MGCRTEVEGPIWGIQERGVRTVHRVMQRMFHCLQGDIRWVSEYLYCAVHFAGSPQT